MSKFFGKKRASTAEGETSWEAEDRKEIESRKKRALERLNERAFYDKADFAKSDRSQGLSGMITAGATTDENNSQFYTLREDGVNKTFMFKTGAPSDSVIASGIFRILGGKRCFGKREIIVYDKNNNRYFPATKFEEDIVENASPSFGDGGKRAKNRTFLVSSEEDIQHEIRSAIASSAREAALIQSKGLNLSQQDINSRLREAEVRALAEEDARIEDEKERERVAVRADARNNVEEKIKEQVKVKTTEENPVLEKSELQNLIKKSQLDALELEENKLLIKRAEERSVNIGYGKNRIEKAGSSQPLNDQVDYSCLVKARYRGDIRLMMDIAYMNGFSFVIGECDSNPQNFILDDKSRVGRIDHGHLSNTHPEPFSRVAVACGEDFKERRERFLKDKGWEQMDKELAAVQRESGVKIKELHGIQERFSNGEILTDKDNKRQSVLEEEIRKLDKKRRKIIAEFEPHNGFIAFQNDFNVDEKELSSHTRSRVYGSRQSIIFLLNEIAGLNHEDVSFEALLNEVRKGEKDPDKHRIEKERIGTKYLKCAENTFNEAIMKPYELRKQDAIDAIKSKIENPDSDNPKGRSVMLFIAFMHGIDEAIKLSEDQKFLDRYLAAFKKAGDGCRTIAEQMIGFLKENGREAKDDFKDFLELYHQNKHKLKEFKHTASRKEKVEWISDSQRSDFDNGESIVLDKGKLKMIADKMTQEIPDQHHFEYTQNIRGKGPVRLVKKFTDRTKNENGKEVILPTCEPSEISGIAITKAKKDASEQVSDGAWNLEAVSQDCFVDKSVFNSKSETSEFHLNLTNDGNNFGNKVFYEIGGTSERKTRASRVNYALAFAHQRQGKGRDEEFLDLSLGSELYSKKDESICLGRPILIEGQRFGAEDLVINELSIALPQDPERKSGDVARQIFFTSLRGFKLCKESVGAVTNKTSPALVKVICSPISPSCVHPFLQMAVQLMSAQVSGVKLEISSKFLDKDNCRDEIKYFQLRVLPDLNRILTENTTINKKLTKINNLCIRREAHFQRRIKERIDPDRYFKMASEFAATDYGNRRKAPEGPSAGNEYRDKIRKLTQKLEEPNAVDDVMRDLSKISAPLPSEKDKSWRRAAKKTASTALGHVTRKERRGRTRQVERELLEALEERGLAHGKTSVLELQEAYHNHEVQKDFQSRRGEIDPIIITYPQVARSNAPKISPASTSNAPAPALAATDPGALGRQVGAGNAVLTEIDLPGAIPSGDTHASKAVQVIALYDKNQSEAVNDAKNKVKDVIESYLKDNYSDDERDQVKKMIEALLEAMCDYANEHLRGIDGKNIDSIMSGGEKAGFSQWRKEKEFRIMLEDKFAKHKIKTDPGYFDHETSPGIFVCRDLSTGLQKKSRGVFEAVKDKAYGDVSSGDVRRNQTRSWRMAMIYGLDEEKLKLTFPGAGHGASRS